MTGGCSEQVPASCPSRAVVVLWEDWATANLLYPLCVHLTLSFLFLVVCGPLYRLLLRLSPKFQGFVTEHVGGSDADNTPQGALSTSAFVVRLVAAPATLSVWVVHSYWHETLPATRALLFGLALVDLYPWTFQRMRQEFRASGLWSAAAVVDTFTIVPSLLILLRYSTLEGTGADWLSLHFLRAFAMLITVLELNQPLHWMGQRGVMAQLVFLVILRLFCLIIVMAGTIFVSEVLGDPGFLADNFVETPGGDRLSAVQMVYWVFVSVTTVGYGDFAPKTVLSRLLTTIFLWVGIASVFTIEFNITEALTRFTEGSGAYRAGRGGRSHTVVILCVSDKAMSMSSTVAGFLKEVFSASYEDARPNVIIFSPTQWDQQSKGGRKAQSFRDFLLEQGFPKAVRDSVWFLVGELNSQADLARAAVGSSEICFVLSDMNSHTPDKDDEQSIFAALMLKQSFPDLRLRLMLLRPQSKELAVQAGILPARCFAVWELKAHMLAQNVRCRGVVPMVTGMMRSLDPRENQEAIRAARQVEEQSCARPTREGTLRTRSINLWRKAGPGADSRNPDFWFHHYLEGLQHNIHGFELSQEYVVLSWYEMVNSVYAATGAVVIATYDGSRIRICPQPSDRIALTTGQICFAIARDTACLDPVRVPDRCHDNWRRRLLQGRDAQLRCNSRDGPHVAAAQLMGHGLKKAMLLQEETAGRPAARMRSSNWTAPGMRKLESVASDTSDGSDTESEGPGVIERCLSEYSFFSHATHATLTKSPSVVEQTETDRVNLTVCRALRRGLPESGRELVVVIVCHGEAWQQVRTFVQAMRSAYLPSWSPIVVFAPTAPPSRLLDGCDTDVLILQGDCMKTKMVIEAGVLEAGAVVVMTGEVPRLESARAQIYKDSRCILLAQELECWCGLSEHEVFTSYELQDSGSVRHLPRLMKKPAVDLAAYLEQRAWSEDSDDESLEAGEEVSPSWITHRMTHRITHRVTRRATAAGKGDAGAQSKTQGRREGDSVLLHPRFAAGQVFSPELWGAMLGRMYHMPAIIELVEGLVMPGRRGQSSYPWQMKVPQHYVGKSFGELFTDLALSRWTDKEGERDAGKQSALPRARMQLQMRSKRSGGQNRQHPAVALALYRKRTEWRDASNDKEAQQPGGPCGNEKEEQEEEEGRTSFFATNGPTEQFAQGTGGHNYVMLSPQPEMELQPDDLVIVLGGRRLGRLLQSQGLLRGGVKRDSAQPAETTGARQNEGSGSPLSPGKHRVTLIAAAENLQSPQSKRSSDEEKAAEQRLQSLLATMEAPAAGARRSVTSPKPQAQPDQAAPAGAVSLPGSVASSAGKNAKSPASSGTGEAVGEAAAAPPSPSSGPKPRVSFRADVVLAAAGLEAVQAAAGLEAVQEEEAAAAPHAKDSA